jgi:MerR family mercuric resistance operon transcriptional regulator
MEHAATFTTGALAARTGCNVETIRYYERIRLLPVPARSVGGHRLYSAMDARRLSFIRRARALGFGLEEVRALLRLAADDDRRCADVRRLASAHLDIVCSKIADLERVKRALEQTITRCPDGTRSDCPIIAALADEPANLAR